MKSQQAQNKQGHSSGWKQPSLKQFLYLNNSKYTPLTQYRPTPIITTTTTTTNTTTTKAAHQTHKNSQPSPKLILDQELERKRTEQRQDQVIRERIDIGWEMEMLRVRKERDEEMKKVEEQRRRKEIEEQARLDQQLRIRQQVQKLRAQIQQIKQTIISPQVQTQTQIIQIMPSPQLITEDEPNPTTLLSDPPQNQVTNLQPQLQPIPQLNVQPIPVKTLPHEQQNFRFGIHQFGLKLLTIRDKYHEIKQSLQETQAYHTLTQTSTTLSQSYLTPIHQLYRTIPSTLTTTKYQLFTKDYSFTSRSIGVASFSILIGLGTFRKRPSYYCMARNTVGAYVLGAFFVTPEIYFGLVKGDRGLGDGGSTK